jgi:hypothetical protein
VASDRSIEDSVGRRALAKDGSNEGVAGSILCEGWGQPKLLPIDEREDRTLVSTGNMLEEKRKSRRTAR